MNALIQIQNAGFNLTISNTGNLLIEPASKLTEQQHHFLKAHKAELLAAIKAEQAANQIISRYVTCYTPSGIAIEVLARDDEHAEFLQRMNPKA